MVECHRPVLSMWNGRELLKFSHLLVDGVLRPLAIANLQRVFELQRKDDRRYHEVLVAVLYCSQSFTEETVEVRTETSA